MKKLLLSVVVMIISITSYAQEKDITKFLGIPIDGTKAEMIAKLKEKGFTPTEYNKDVLEGEFNGTEVYVHIVTNNNKVYRIAVIDKISKNATDIKIRFNNLCYQFKNNTRYSSGSDQAISEEEDISYEMTVHNKRYEAIFFQTTKEQDEDVNNISEMLVKTILDSTLSEDDRKEKQKEIADKIFESSSKGMHKVVWFMISKDYGKFYITMFYDNELNKANGEDL